MSEKTIVVRRRKSDGKLFYVQPDGSEVPVPKSGPLPHLTEEEIIAAALTDPDNPPGSAELSKHRRRLPQVRQMRRALRLTQEEFSERFRIPIGTLRDWEQGKSVPDQAAKAYLTVIARNPDAVVAALEARR